MGKIVAGILGVDEVAELLAVAGGAARIGVEHDEAAGGLDLHLMLEADAVHGVRAAVNFENKWILFRRIKVRRLDDPALDILAVAGIEAEFLDRADLDLRRQAVVRR